MEYGLHPSRLTLENQFKVSFNSRFKDELLNIKIPSLQEAQLLAEQHRIKYNTYKPHSALKGVTPLEVIRDGKRPERPPALRRSRRTKRDTSRGIAQLQLDS